MTSDKRSGYDREWAEEKKRYRVNMETIRI